MDTRSVSTEMMAWLLCFTCVLLCGPELLQGTASEYRLESETLSQCESLRAVAVARQQDVIPQCLEDGSFRPVQCGGRGQQQCWCVDAEGHEVLGSRTSSSDLHCPSPCQLQSLLKCTPSGLFEPVQCDSNSGQCWCVDQDGMEVYGTRQRSRPHHCPGSCEVRGRRLLHGMGSSSPPQCDRDGSFLPVQCKFINMTDRREVDLLHTFNRFPESFETFSSFRENFPMVSSYCYCSDSRGRELDNTGVELLLSEVDDSVTLSLRSVHSFDQTNVYRVLQRRMLGVRLILTGVFRCPSPCEVEREAASASASSTVFVPSCESGGAFISRQCQQGGQCWCVDPTGRELPGSRQFGDSVVCSSDHDCRSQRRLALSSLFSGPVALPSSMTSPPASCLSLLRPLQNLLSGVADPTFLSRLVEVLDGVFPSVGGALQTLRRVAPGRLQEELFGGKFLMSVANFNLSGAVGSRGPVSVELLSSQKNRDLVWSVSQALEDAAFLSALRHTLMGLNGSLSLQQVLVPLLRYCTAEEQKYSAAIFVPTCTSSGSFQEVQCHSGDCWCVDPRGQEVTGSRTSGRRPRCPSRCERERAMALKVRGNMAAGADIYVPACSEDGHFLPLQCVGARCFCVDTEGRTTTGPKGGAITCAGRMTQSASGVCSQVLSEVTTFTEQVQNVVALSRSSHFPLGYGFLLSEGLRLNLDELHVSQSEEVLQITDRLLSRSRAALRLAAYSTVQMYLPPQRRSYQPYTPQCDTSGNWLHTQCHHSTGQCWCVDEDGEYVTNSLSSRSLRLPKCLTRCQRAQAHTLLSGWTKRSNVTMLPHPPQCEEDGRYSVLQTGGAAASCVNPLTGEVMQAATQGTTGQLTCPTWCELQGLHCRPDGSFVPLQCDVTSCWCVSVDGQEVDGTRTPRQTGRTPSCDRPLCPHPAVTYSTLICHPVVNGQQSCDLICRHGYHNALPVSSFLCDSESGKWGGDSAPLSGACQISQPLQMMSSSQLWLLSSSCSQLSTLKSLLFRSMTSRGLCSAQLPVSGSLVELCDESSVRLQCDGDESLKLTLTWTVALSDLPTSDLPDLHDIVVFLNQSKFLEGVQELLRDIKSTLVSTTPPSFSCSHGYRLTNDGEGCLVCPAGTYFREGACPLCPRGTYQEEEGQDHCNKCPRGSSPAGASSVNQCETECQRRGLRCSERGDFLSAQPDFLSGRWMCFNSEGVELEWTSSNKVLTDEECSVLSRFQVVPGSSLIIRAEDTDVLQTMTSDLRTCLQACAVEPRCHHVALSNSQSQCDLYSTHTLNTHCTTSQQTTGFLGNPQAEVFDWLSCSMKVRGGASDMLVFRKTGAESSSRSVRTVMMKAVSGVFRTQVFSSGRSSLSDVHRFCQDGCSRDTCCDGFILNQNTLSGGSLLCGWLRAPSVLTCGDQDWDVIGNGKANRICGAGLTYNKQQKSFVFNFGGQEFNITDSALSTDSKNKDYQSSIVSFQAVYLNTDESDSGSFSCAAAATQVSSSSLDSSVQLKFVSLLDDDDVIIDPHKKLPALTFWLNKKNYNSQQALLWCLTRCDAESQCHVADLTEADSAGFFSCRLFPDTRVCGDYDKPLRRACRLLLDRAPNNTYSRTVDLSGPVKSFYQRVSFQKMVSYSVRNRVSVTEKNVALTQRFKECERRCDEDPCCRGIGFVQDTKSPGTAATVCVSLLSLGVLTCDEDVSSSWKPQDCSPSTVKSSPEPFGWYFKPVNQWTNAPALCPDFNLPPTNVSLSEWRLLDDSSVLVDPSVSTYDVIHISRDIAADNNKTRDWCLHTCQGAESCVAVSFSETEFAIRCVLYPDTTACGLSSTPGSSTPASSCKLVIKEPARKVYLRTEWLPAVTSVSISGHGILQGVAVETVLNLERRKVVLYLGVPYARPPIGSLRFEEAQPADWSGTWDATKPRATCLQPGDAASDPSSEDCLYLNIFSPAAQRGRVPVLVVFFNPSANQSPALLSGSTLAAVGNIVVVTANYRTAALGFLSTGDSRLLGNYGLSDQEAVLRWVNKHISVVGGDNSRVTVGAERGGADITSLHLASSSSPPLFHRMILMGGSIFSPALLDSVSSSKRLALDLASELGCVTTDLAACLRAAPPHALNAAQTKLMAVSGPFRSWSPLRPSTSSLSSYHSMDLLLGTSEHDGLISRARRIKDFEVLQGRVNAKTAFYEALSRSLGGEEGSEQMKEAATWFYSLDHSPTPAGYSLFSRALNNATRDLFVTCPSLQMASSWAKNNNANVFLYHLPANSAHDRADVSVPLDVQFVFGVPNHPISSQRFTPSDRRLSLAMMTYVSSFVRTGNPNPSRVWEESILPRWHPVQSSEAPPTYLEMSPALLQRRGLREEACSFWRHMRATLSRQTGQLRSASLKPSTQKSRDTQSTNQTVY